MLILPLHRPLTRANFPWVTAALVLVNLFVFLFLQSGDGRAQQQAMHHYEASGLAEMEAPLYLAHLHEQASPGINQDPDFAALPTEVQAMVLQQAQMGDPQFRARLERGELFADAEAFANWQPKAAEFARLREAIFTERHALHAEQPEVSGMLSSMFLHGGFDHILGNMLFLIALGLLVEGPLGHGRFLLLYLLGGVGAAAVWLAFSDVGSVIGASGAIAALMGAFCVLWGRRKVRFFYWFFVVFDYIKGPALALFPVWLGWELLQWALRDGSRVAFEAHAGGIVSGALLALVAKQFGWERTEAYDESSAAKPGDNTRALNEVRDLVGKLQLDEARAALDPLLARADGLETRLLAFRIAQLAGRKQEALVHGRALLAAVAGTAAQRDEQMRVYAELRRDHAAESVGLGWQLAGRLVERGAGSAVPLLDGLLSDPVAVQALPFDQALPWALKLQAQGATATATQLLRALLRAQPDSISAGKAGFLLSEWGQQVQH